ncbi:MAG: sigma 54-interacting transcriptional regulator, partial [Verrucomicrobiota bacterium]
ALGERTIERVGGNTPIKVDVRVVTATNKDLEALVTEKKFREDLFYRLNVVRITIPPLRQRKDDIIPLANHFLKKAAEENDKPFRELTPEAMQCLLDFHWPGNVRQLRTVIEHGVVMGNGSRITPRNLPPTVRETHKNKNGSESDSPKIALESTDDFNLHAMERRLITRALERTGENRTEAAKLLGISRRTLQRKLKEKEEGK